MKIFASIAQSSNLNMTQKSQHQKSLQSRSSNQVNQQRNREATNQHIRINDLLKFEEKQKSKNATH